MPRKRPEPTPPTTLVQLPLAEVHADPAQPRRSFDEAALRELASSIERVGLLHPVPVRPRAEGGYLLISGERRLRAYRLLVQSDPAYTTIPALVTHLSEPQARSAALIENVVREDLNPIERAEALHDLRKGLHTTWQGVAERTGVSQRRVLQLAGLLSLPGEVRRALRQGSIGEPQVRGIKLLGKSAAAMRLLAYVEEHPELSGDEVLALGRIIKRRPGLTPQAARELRDAGHPAADLPPLPPGPRQTRVGQTLAALRTALRHCEALASEPAVGQPAVELLRLCDEVGAQGRVLRALWAAERLAE